MIYIFTLRYYDFDRNIINIGGTQTYFSTLSQYLKSDGYEVKILDIKRQASSKRHINYDGIFIEEFAFKGSLNKAFHKFYKNTIKATDIVIVGSDEYDIYPVNLPNVISVQHGIGWDITREAAGKRKKGILFPMYKAWINFKRIYKFSKSSHYVCVDYNYYNWVKALYEIPYSKKIRVIPNFARNEFTELEIKNKLLNQKPLQYSKILFARRFQDFRGAIIWAKVVSRLSDKYPNLSFTFAGEGPCENIIKNLLEGRCNIEYTKYSHQNSLKFHYSYDIVVVPTLFSEGTSLSACEAMAAGCYPIVTYVGGLANIVINHFNGTMCYPSEDALFAAVDSVLSLDQHKFQQRVMNAYYTSTLGFSADLWYEQWRNFLNDIARAK